MEITLNHTIVPVYNNIESAEFYESIFGFEFVREWGHFAVVKINKTLTFDFISKKDFPSLHYAFKVNDAEFDEILEAVKLFDMPFGSSPNSLEDGKINHLYGGRGVYFKDINAHVLEIITKDYIMN